MEPVLGLCRLSPDIIRNIIKLGPDAAPDMRFVSCFPMFQHEAVVNIQFRFHALGTNLRRSTSAKTPNFRLR